MRFIKTVLISSMFIVSGCSYLYGENGVIHNRDTTYLKARSIPPLTIPPGISSSTIHQEYPVPERSYPASAQKVSLVPPGL